MSWIQQNANNYIHSNAPFSLQYIGSSWYLIDNRDQSKAIPFNDIFDNPVFSVDFSNQSILAKHFRGEGVNTPATPAFSFQGDLNTGMYRISGDTVGFAANGIKQGEFGVGYGGFTGNIVQVISETQNFQTNFTTTYVDINKSSGVVWETVITPKFANSRLLIIYKLSTTINGFNMGFRISQKIASGSYAIIYKPEETNATAPFSPLDMGAPAAVIRNQWFLPVIITPTYTIGDSITTKIQGATDASTATVNNPRTGNNGHSEIFIFEIAG